MAIHIGKIVKDTVRQKGMDVTVFADKINYTRRNVYKIFAKETIDTGLLAKISKVLGQNFFFYFIADEEISDYRNSKVKSTEVVEALKNLQATVSALNQKKKTSARSKSKLQRQKKK